MIEPDIAHPYSGTLASRGKEILTLATSWMNHNNSVFREVSYLHEKANRDSTHMRREIQGWQVQQRLPGPGEELMSSYLMGTEFDFIRGILF